MPTAATAREGPPLDAVQAAIELNLAGLPCRIVDVSHVLPTPQPPPGSRGNSRVRMCYAADEIAHFECNGRRWALVPLSGSARREGEGTPGPDADEDAGGEGALPDMVTHLTNRELQIVQLICAGLLTKQVADRLHLSEFTVRSYLKAVYAKLGVRSRGAMVYRYAQQFGAALNPLHPSAPGAPVVRR